MQILPPSPGKQNFPGGTIQMELVPHAIYSCSQFGHPRNCRQNPAVGSKMWGLCYITNNWMRKRPARVKENQKTKYFFFCIYLFTTWHLYWFYFSSFSGKKKRERKKKKMWVELFECFEPILFTQELIGLIYSNTMNAERVKKILEQNRRV